MQRIGSTDNDSHRSITIAVACIGCWCSATFIACTDDPIFLDASYEGQSTSSPDRGGSALAPADSTAPSDSIPGQSNAADIAVRTDAPLADEGINDLGRADPPPDSPVNGRCVQAADVLTCTYNTHSFGFSDGLLEKREVHWEVPVGMPPSEGWPVVLMFQGSFLNAENAWNAQLDDVVGTWNRTATIQALLEAGYAVITPEAHFDGNSFWDTNVVPYNVMWSIAPDHQLMQLTLDALPDGTFGPVDPTMIYAAGFSSGGYMASRVALTYENVKAIAVHSASYATCAGNLCLVPPLPEDHAPTLFLHGTTDLIVPAWTSLLYHDALTQLGIETTRIAIDGVGHEWLDQAPEAIVSWFDQF